MGNKIVTLFLSLVVNVMRKRRKKERKKEKV